MTRQQELFPDPKLQDLVADVRAAPPHEVNIRTTNYPRCVLDAECLTIDVGRGKGKKARKTYTLVSTEGLDWEYLEAELVPLIASWEGKVWPEGTVRYHLLSLRQFLDAARK
jgi:hypothetical protein